ncbi:hypothetical protein CC2G_007985 [Coprinopsis cinerea AmutBmut pab1-1]|nr:hypothetical protein CC2G_007985 [Coprinopsis cinerea AmutBmut pab1-1]
MARAAMSSPSEVPPPDDALLAKVAFKHAMQQEWEAPWYGFYAIILQPLSRIYRLEQEDETLPEDDKDRSFLACTILHPQHPVTTDVELEQIYEPIPDDLEDEIDSDSDDLSDSLSPPSSPTPGPPADLNLVQLIEDPVLCSPESARSGGQASPTNSDSPVGALSQGHYRESRSVSLEPREYRRIRAFCIPDFLPTRTYLRPKTWEPITTRHDLLVEVKGLGWLKKYRGNPISYAFRQVLQQLYEQAGHSFRADPNLQVISLLAIIGPHCQYSECRRGDSRRYDPLAKYRDTTYEPSETGSDTPSPQLSGRRKRDSRRNDRFAEGREIAHEPSETENPFSSPSPPPSPLPETPRDSQSSNSSEEPEEREQGAPSPESPYLEKLTRCVHTFSEDYSGEHRQWVQALIARIDELDRELLQTAQNIYI